MSVSSPPPGILSTEDCSLHGPHSRIKFTLQPLPPPPSFGSLALSRINTRSGIWCRAELREKQKKRLKKKKASSDVCGRLYSHCNIHTIAINIRNIALNIRIVALNIRLTWLDEEEGEEEDEEEHVDKKLKFGAVGKNPNAVTGFLPDRCSTALHADCQIYKYINGSLKCINYHIGRSKGEQQ
eukprot:5567403-Pyramimonas_sp.AAC.2